MAAIGTLRDNCKLAAAAAATAPSPLVSYSYGSEIRCRFSDISTREEVSMPRMGDIKKDATTEKINAVIRLPKGTTVASDYRIQLTKKKGVTVSPNEFYEIIGRPRKTLSQIVCSVKLLIGSSDS